MKNQFQKNIDTIYDALKIRYPNLNISKMADMLNVGRATLYKYWINDGQEPRNLSNKWLRRIVGPVNTEFNTNITPDELLGSDCSFIKENALKEDREHQMEFGLDYRPKYEDFASELHYLRKKNNLTLNNVAEISKKLYPNNKEKQIVGVYVMKLEKGVSKNPSPHKIQTLAEIYKVPIERLLKLIGLFKPAMILEKEKIVLNINPEYMKRNNLTKEELKKRIMNLLSFFPGLIKEN